jgi:hypothetical protein
MNKWQCTIYWYVLHPAIPCDISHRTADDQSTVTYRQGMSVNYQSPNFARRGYIFPLTGITLPLFPPIKRVQDLIARRRAIPDITWDDDQHLDVVEAADAMLDALKEEKKCMDRLITGTSALITLTASQSTHLTRGTACGSALMNF